MDALKLTSKTIAALMLAALPVTMAGCAVATGTGEETEGQTSAAVAEGKAGSENTRAAKGNGETGESAASPVASSTQLGLLPPSADPVPEPWQAPPTTTSTRAPLKPTLAPQELPQ